MVNTLDAQSKLKMLYGFKNLRRIKMPNPKTVEEYLYTKQIRMKESEIA